MFDGKTGKMSRFLITYKLFIRIRIKEAVVEEQIQWVLLYVQKKSADIWKENILEDLETKALEYVTVGEFLADLKKERNKE